MLKLDDNDRLCRVGPGTPGAELFRSIWLPALRSAQLVAPRCAPVRLRLLGEDLVAFRDGAGKVGIVQAYCAHRLAPLFYGKVEDQGLRCSYHGWLYGTDGQCLQIPSDPANTALCQKIKLRAYRVIEKADVVWIYMGDGEPPALPRFPWMDLAPEQRSATVWLQETNWFQGVEGEIDSSHVSILHKTSQQVSAARVHRPYTFSDPRPVLCTRETPIGFMSIARRKADHQFYWRVTQWMAPMFSFVPSAAWPIGGRAWVPIDDGNTYTWDFTYSPDGPLPPEYAQIMTSGVSFPPEMGYRACRLDNGSTIDTWVPKRTRENDYLVDRERQRGVDQTGIHGVNDQDRAMQEGMGRIVDRSRERLVASDATVVAARRKMLEILRSAEALQAFRALVADGSAYSLLPIDTVVDESDVDQFLARHGVRVAA